MKPHHFCDGIIEKKMQIETAFPLSKRLINQITQLYYWPLVLLVVAC